MDKTNLDNKKETAESKENQKAEETTNLQEEQVNASAENATSDNVADKKAEEAATEEKDSLQKKYDELNDSHLRLRAEFDNYRKRTLREKSELIKNGGESALTHLLPVIDDFERALQNIRTAEDMKAVSEGVELIYSKFISYLSQQNVKPIETVGSPFDAETSEAVAMIPAPELCANGLYIEWQGNPSCKSSGRRIRRKVATERYRQRWRKEIIMRY